MYDPKVKQLGNDAFGNPHGYRGAYLIDALERWSEDQPVGRKATAREISQEVARYRKFQSPSTHGPLKCSRIVVTDPRWYKQGSLLIKGTPPTDTTEGFVAAWIAATSPGRMSAKEHATAYNAWANDNGAQHCHYTAIAKHLRAAGYVIVSKPNNRAIYERQVVVDKI